jgi:hypothetical protein
LVLRLPLRFALLPFAMRPKSAAPFELPFSLPFAFFPMARTVTAESVSARNAFNGLANETEGHLIRLLSQWQGRKVWKVSGHGGLTTGFSAAFDQYCASHAVNQKLANDKAGPVWLSLFCQHGLMAASLRHLPSALKADLYLGRTDDAGILVGLCECQKRCTGYSVEGVNSAHREAYRLECAARELRSSVRDFD